MKVTYKLSVEVSGMKNRQDAIKAAKYATMVFDTVSYLTKLSEECSKDTPTMELIAKIDFSQYRRLLNLNESGSLDSNHITSEKVSGSPVYDFFSERVMPWELVKSIIDVTVSDI